MPPNAPLGKVTALTYYLCKLRNYCINENESKYHEQIKIDSFFSAVNGSIAMANDGNRNLTPNETQNGGEHSDDYNCNKIKVINIPREQMLEIIREKDLCRPPSK